jgi:hypothetical protein
LSSDSEKGRGSIKEDDYVINDPNKSPMSVKVERKIVFGTKKNSMYVKKDYLEDSNYSM